MNQSILILISVIFYQISIAQNRSESTELWNPVPEKIETSSIGHPPSDAIVLFDGKDLLNFTNTDGTEADWKIENDYMTVNTVGKSIKTKQKFGSCQIHIEWCTPQDDTLNGQEKGNSGIFLMERYEIQILDSWKNKTYSNGQAGSIYKQHIPLVNPCKKPGDWQSFDIIFIAPVFGKRGDVISPAKITLFFNGVVVHYDVPILGTTKFIGFPQYKIHNNKESIMIQNHHNSVCFRNIWIREL